MLGTHNVYAIILPTGRTTHTLTVVALKIEL